uniref:Uncharacterized protein n=1 Tax=Ditylenchus dipsaci TaxID=166011 RepID=A0A915CXN5_9BILA
MDANRQAALGTIVTAFVSVALSLTEIFILASVTYFNEKRYNSRIFMQSGNSLSEAYQLSENIRTGKQLAPTFLFHFCNTLLLAIGSSLVYFKFIYMPRSQELLSIFFYFTLSFFNLCIQTTVIRYHPILSKQAGLLCHDIKQRFCKWLGSNNRVTILDKETKANTAANAVATTVTGNRLFQQVTADEHLQIMRTTWDKYVKIKGIRSTT